MPASVYVGVFVLTNAGGSQFRYRMPSAPGSGSITDATVQKVMGVGRLVVEGNTIELATSPTGLQAIYVNDQNHGLGPDYAHGDAIIQNNRIRYLDGAAPVDATATALQAHGIKNLIVRNNVVESANPQPLQNTRCGHATYLDNRTTAAALMARLEDRKSVV